MNKHLGVRMKDGEPPRFSSVQEELEYWKRNALERKAELEELEVDYQEIRDSSRILEEEMERELKTTNTKLEEVSKAYANLASRSEDTAVRYSADPKEDLNINNLYSKAKNRQSHQETLILSEKLQVRFFVSNLSETHALKRCTGGT